MGSFLSKSVPAYLPDRSAGVCKQDDVMRMVNPVPGEYTTLLPFTKRWGWDLNQCVLGFSNLSNQDKALRISYPIDQNGITCNWEVLKMLLQMQLLMGNFIGLCTGPCGIWVSDFDTEQFGTLSLPYHCRKIRANLGVYKDSIFVSRHVDDDYYDENEYNHPAI